MGDVASTAGISLRAAAAAAAVVLVLVLAPLTVAQYPPLHDYPFHLARADILKSLPASDFVREHYQASSFLLPNVGMDVLMLGLVKLMPVMLAGRVLLAIVLTLILTGVTALHYVLHRRLSPWPLLVAFLLYNWVFLLGFLNYLVGIGFMLWGTACWLALRDGSPWLRMAIGTALGLLMLLCHLAAFGVFALVIGGFELQSAFAHRLGLAAVRRLAIAAAPFVLTAAVFFLLSPAAGEAEAPIAYMAWWGWKPLMMVRTPQSGAFWNDLLTLGTVTLGIVVLAILRRIRFATPMLLSIGLLVAAFIALPRMLFGSDFADSRLPVAIAFVLLACTDLEAVEHRVALALAAAAGVLLLARSVAICMDWVRYDRVIAQVHQAFALLPDGSTVLAATAAPLPLVHYADDSQLVRLQPPLKHVVSLASLSRPIFVPSTWADPMKQPISVTPHYQPMRNWQTNNPHMLKSSADLAGFERRARELHGSSSARSLYLLLLYPDMLPGGLPGDLQPIARGPRFALLQLK